MPYIKPEDRVDLVDALDSVHPKNAGELNFCITSLIVDYLSLLGIRYSSINEVIGVLECAKLELYRRVAAPYEDQKRHDNGDVYE